MISARQVGTQSILRQVLKKHVERLTGELLCAVGNHLRGPRKFRVLEQGLHEKERPSKPEGFPSLMKGPAPLSCFDDHGGMGDQCHGAIAHGEISRSPRISAWKLRKREMLPDDLALEGHV